MVTYCQQEGCPIGGAETVEHSYTEPAIPSQESQKSSQEKLHANSQNSIIPNSLKVDTTQPMYGKQNVGQPQNGKDIQL